MMKKYVASACVTTAAVAIAVCAVLRPSSLVFVSTVTATTEPDASHCVATSKRPTNTSAQGAVPVTASAKLSWTTASIAFMPTDSGAAPTAVEADRTPMKSAPEMRMAMSIAWKVAARVRSPLYFSKREPKRSCSSSVLPA